MQKKNFVKFTIIILIAITFSAGITYADVITTIAAKVIDTPSPSDTSVPPEGAPTTTIAVKTSDTPTPNDVVKMNETSTVAPSEETKSPSTSILSGASERIVDPTSTTIMPSTSELVGVLEPDLDGDGTPDSSDPINVITSDTTLTTNHTVIGNVIVQDNVVLTIPDGLTLSIPSGSNITIQLGGGVLIEFGGTLQLHS